MIVRLESRKVISPDALLLAADKRKGTIGSGKWALVHTEYGFKVFRWKDRNRWL